jgi:hypothetical protein
MSTPTDILVNRGGVLSARIKANKQVLKKMKAFWEVRRLRRWPGCVLRARPRDSDFEFLRRMLLLHPCHCRRRF